MVSQKAILNLALQFDNACTAKDDLRKAYEKFRIIPGPVGIVQAAKLLKQRDILHGLDGDVMSTQEYMKKVIEDVGKDEDFKNGSWVSTTDYVNANGGTVSGCLGDIKNFLNNEKLEQVVAIVKSCSPNVIGDLTVTMKDLSGTIAGTIHHKVIDEGGYEKDITAGAALILTNVSVFSPKPSMHYLNITRRNVVKVFRKDTIPESGSGITSHLPIAPLVIHVSSTMESALVKMALKAHIGDNVEIGANSCIDRGRIGDYVTLGGRVGVRDHVTIASKDITKPGDYGGFPAVPIREWRRQGDSDDCNIIVEDEVAGVATQIKDNVTSEGNVQNNQNGEGLSNTLETSRMLRRSTRQKIMPAKFNDFVVNSSVRYWLEKYVCYANLSSVNHCFSTTLNKFTKPKIFHEGS
ncbi:hypothetical protein Tco_0548609 [Tanacetum coccineum]